MSRPAPSVPPATGAPAATEIGELERTQVGGKTYEWRLASSWQNPDPGVVRAAQFRLGQQVYPDFEEAWRAMGAAGKREEKRTR